MQIHRLLTDERAVPPVIGVILLVAITVILSAVIATFVLGLGENVASTAPQATFAFDFEEIHEDTSGNLTVRHESGDSVRVSELYVRGQNGSNGRDYQWSDTWAAITAGHAGTPQTDRYGGTASGELGSETAVVSGDAVTVAVGTDAELRIIYEPQRGDTSATLGEWAGPDA